VDPGPGSIVQSTKMSLKAEKLSAIILSHRHLDHAADTNIMAEAMTQGGFKRHGRLYAPSDAIDTEPVIFPYIRKLIEGIEILEEGKTYKIGNVSLNTPVKHIHPVETYGFVFTSGSHSFSHITDTRYFDGLADYYKNELLIINVVFLEPRTAADHPGLPIDHLSVPDVERLVKEIKPKVAIMTHFGMSVWRAKPLQIAERLTDSTGIRVIAAQDGMEFNLSELDDE